MRALSLLALTYLFSALAAAEMRPIELNPALVNSQVKMITGPHLVYSPRVEGNGLLLITLGGSFSKPSDLKDLHAVAVEKGYVVLALDYPNQVNTMDCRKTHESYCFDNFREEIVAGHDVSSLVAVDKANSIRQRIKETVFYLSGFEPRFANVIKNGKIDWSKIVLVGHSQGAGHVFYLAKKVKVHRAIAIAGPQDNFQPTLAGWLSKPGRTPADRHFALLHARDGLNPELQAAAFMAVIGGDEAVLRNHLIVTDKPVHDGHLDLIKTQFSDEWRQLL